MNGNDGVFAISGDAGSLKADTITIQFEQATSIHNILHVTDILGTHQDIQLILNKLIKECVHHFFIFYINQSYF